MGGRQPAGPAVFQLEKMLYRELADIGIDPGKTASEPPSQGSEVFDLEAVPVDPDGNGPLDPTGYRLTWTERLVGDYDQNSEVNVADLSPLAAHWHLTVDYDDPRLHDDVEYYPVGDPSFAGDIGEGTPPAVGSGAYNWRLARVDGDGNGEINASDITPIAVHFKQHLDGYRVYRRSATETEFQLLEDPANPGTPLLVSREDANGGAGIDAARPVLYEYIDEFEVDAQYEYRVAPYDANSDEEGPPSWPGFNEPSNVVAQITADVTQGVPPLTVEFDASQSTSLTSQITDYAWDLDGDGLLEEFSGDSPYISREYLATGSWLVSVEVTNADGESDVASILISITTPPTARLTVSPEWLEVPVLVTFDASGSFDTDGEVVGYEWDLNNDGVFELDTGPLSYRLIEVDASGGMTVGVRVRDNLGAAGSTTVAAEFTDDYLEQEDNDSFAAGMDFGTLAAGESLSGISGGIGSGLYDGDDIDWFRFSLADGALIEADLAFQHADANLTLGLYGPDQDVKVAESATPTDNESLATPALIAGSYFLLVSRAVGPGGASAEYSLSLQISELAYDELEPNDTGGEAQDLGNIDSGLLPQFIGNLGPGGYDGDGEDWYAFSVGVAENYSIGLKFFHDAADLEMQLYAGDGTTLLGSASSVSDNESVLAELLPGAYLLRCYWFEGGDANYSLSILYE